MKHISEHIKAVLLDHDDTLVGTFKAKSAHHKHVARTYYNKELTDAEVREHWGKPLQELVCLLYGTADIEQAMANNTSCHESFPKELFAASIPTLHRLKSAGKFIGVITATSRFSFEHDLELHKVPRELLDFTQTAEDTPFHKPDPRVFELAIARLAEENIRPEEALYVGDGLHDMKAALGAGFHFLGVETGLVTADEFKQVGAASIASVAELAH